MIDASYPPTRYAVSILSASFESAMGNLLVARTCNGEANVLSLPKNQFVAIERDLCDSRRPEMIKEVALEG